MKRFLVALAACAALATPAAAQAHPLGNFTVNRFSAVELSGNRAYVKYVLDMAEIPTYQERQQITNVETYETALTGRIGRGLQLRVDGQAVALTPLAHELAFPPGMAGLRTLRFEAVYASPPLNGGQARLDFADTNYRDRIGWKEVVVQAGRGAQVSSSTVPSTSISQELLAYPKDLLTTPPEVTGAQAIIEPGDSAGQPPALLSREQLAARVAVRATGDGGFASLIAKRDLGPGVILLSLLVALFWGAAHALSPGHGKAIVTAYLVGQRGTPKHAAALGLIVTATHTVGVFVLGFVTLALSQFIVPEQLYPWIGLLSGLLVIGVGASVLFARVRHRRAHSHDHHHHHDHAPEELSWRSLTAVGISGGLLPCPSALVVLLAAISLHRVALGLLLIVAFSAGLALSITGIGLVAVFAKRSFRRFELQGRVIGLLPAVSALVIVIAGVAMTARALPKVS
ncbi:MAG TPA: sulfite exporter TauE/SafE family protein [Gaiellaceae bacterium]|nr:sulfite exporter TauE/SafE family protein [Gaiellaceae bacterium]